VTNGLYDLLKESIISLTTRAPYPEAQIYEIESDVWRSRERWQSGIPTEEQFNEFGELDREIAFTFIIHAICVTRIVGALKRSDNDEPYSERSEREMRDRLAKMRWPAPEDVERQLGDADPRDAGTPPDDSEEGHEST
jgi:hypothetical protein